LKAQEAEEMSATDVVALRPAYRYRFVILGVVWTSYLIVYLSRLSIGPLAPFLKDAFNLSNAQIGSLMSATAITYAPAMIVAGILVDRIGVRRILISGTFVAGICVGLLFLAPSYGMLLALLTLSGFGCGCIYPSAVKAIMLWFPPRERATAVGLNQSAINVSGIAGAALLPAVALSLGWEYGFLFVGVVALLISLGCFALYRDPEKPACVEQGAYNRFREEPTRQNEAEVSSLEVAADSAEVGDGTAGHAGWRQIAQLFRTRDIWFLCCTGLLLGIVEFSVLAHLVLYLNKSLAYATVAAGGLLALCEAAGAFGKPLSGLVSDRVFRGRRKPAFLGMCVAATVVCAVFAVLGGNIGWAVYPCLLVFGIAAIGWGGLYGTMAGEIAGTHLAGLAAGVCSAIVNLGIVVGPLVFGYLVDSSGDYTFPWILMTVCGGLGVVTLSLVREPRAAR
jgi:ACS family hexuronate transporter-like MFS transporter